MIYPTIKLIYLNSGIWRCQLFSPWNCPALVSVPSPLWFSPLSHWPFSFSFVDFLPCCFSAISISCHWLFLFVPRWSQPIQGLFKNAYLSVVCIFCFYSLDPNTFWTSPLLLFQFCWVKSNFFPSYNFWHWCI